MAEEETTIIRKITFHPARSAVDDVIRLLRDLPPTEKIYLVLYFMKIDGFRFSETVELRELILVKNSNIHHLEVFDCFEFFVPFLSANNGETKHFFYCDTTKIPMQLDQATVLSDAIRTNNNNGNIESFLLSRYCDSSAVFQPILDALLVTGVQQIKLFWKLLENNEYSNNIDFSNISTNTSLKELMLIYIPLDETNLFDSIKGNKTLEKLLIQNHMMGTSKVREIRALQEMLCENITLIDLRIFHQGNHHILQEQIDIYTKLNRMWIRYIIKQKERIASAVAAAAAISTTTIPTVATTIDDATVKGRTEEDSVDEVEKNKKVEEEKKMMKNKKEMNLWLKTFEKKPVMRNELIYLFLIRNADMYNNNVTPSTVVEGRKKRKRQK